MRRHLSGPERAERVRGCADGALRDVRYALRGLRREPLFAAGVIATLALGLGANAAMAGLLDRLLLRPPPHVRDAGRVARVAVEHAGFDGRPFVMSTMPYPAFDDVRTLARAFEDVAAARPEEMTLGGGADATRLRAEKVSGGYFRLLGTRPALGRFFGEDEDRAPAGTPVAVLSHDFWRRQLGGDASALGRPIHLDGTAFTVVGVAPRGFTGAGIEPVDVWVPLAAGAASLPPDWRTSRFFNAASVVARLRPGVALGAAAEDATRALRAGAAAAGVPDDDEAARPPRVVLGALAPGRAADGAATAETRVALRSGAVALVVLLTSMANVATLLLLRAVRRRREIAVRLALGAGRGRLARQLLTESLLLAAAGGAAALLVAAWGGELLRATLLPNLAAGEGTADLRVLAVTAAAALAAGVVAGLAPVMRAASAGAGDALRGGAAGGESVRRSRLLAVLLVAQTGFSAAMLVGAGLFVRSLHNARSQDLGFDPARVLLATFDFRNPPAAEERDAIYAAALERVRRAAGVAHVTPVQSVPFSFHHVLPVSVPGRPTAPMVGGQLPFLNAATAEYFRVIGMRVVDGRPISDADRAGAPLVVVVNETMAHRVWPGERAVGKCIRFGVLFGPDGLLAGDPGPAADESLPCREVVGVVRDVRRRSVRPEDVTMQYYVPFEQVPNMPGQPAISSLLLLARGDVRATAREVRLAMLGGTAGDADAPLAAVQPLQELIDPQLRPWRLGASAFTAFGGLALAMAALGLYAALGYAVAQRAREMGVRSALGATRGDVVRLVLAGALRDAGSGLLLGGAAALAAGPWVAPLLFGVSPRDPAVFGAVALTLGVVAALAALGPALRAARADPASVMRTE